MEGLPKDIWRHVQTFLHPREVLTLRLCSKTLNSILIENDSYWNPRVQELKLLIPFYFVTRGTNLVLKIYDKKSVHYYDHKPTSRFREYWFLFGHRNAECEYCNFQSKARSTPKETEVLCVSCWHMTFDRCKSCWTCENLAGMDGGRCPSNCNGRHGCNLCRIYQAYHNNETPHAKHKRCIVCRYLEKRRKKQIK